MLITWRRLVAACVLLASVTAASLALASTGKPIHTRTITVTVPTPRNRPRAGGKAATPPATKRAPAQHAHAPASTTPMSATSLQSTVGSKIISGMNGTFPSQALLTRVRAGHIGGVILFSQNVSSHLPAAVRTLQTAAHHAQRRLVIAIDQEGGTVSRLAGAPPYESAAAMTPDSATVEGSATGRALLRLGINTDLAPVADVAHPGGFLGSRAFASNPARVAIDACGFATGLTSAGVNATFKHFPGLGGATTNTDNTTSTVSLSFAALVADLAPYRRCLPPLIMISSASYPTLDAERPAALSRTIVQNLLRDRLGFQGVTISDTLTAPAVNSSQTPRRAADAGIDMLLYPDETTANNAYHQLLKDARAGLLDKTQLAASKKRIDALTITG